MSPAARKRRASVRHRPLLQTLVLTAGRTMRVFGLRPTHPPGTSTSPPPFQTVARTAPTRPSSESWCGSCCVPEVSDLRLERSLEGGSRRAAFDVGGQTLVARDDVG